MESPPASVFEISSFWEGSPLPPSDRIKIWIWSTPNSPSPLLHIKVHAPFFDNPPPASSKEGITCNCLWEFEIVQVFIKGRMDKYIEIEMSPHDEYLVLAMDGHRQCFHESLTPDFYRSEIDRENRKWRAEISIPFSFLPPPFVCTNCSLFTFNAFASHWVEKNRRECAALFPAFADTFQYSEPDFHRLHLFEPLPAEITRNFFHDVPDEFAAKSPIWKSRLGSEIKRSSSFVPINWD